MVEASRKRILSPESYARMITGYFGRHHSPETRAKMSITRRSPELREKMSILHRGKHPSLDARKKMSLARRGKTLSLEHRAKISAAHIGKKASIEARIKMSISQKERYKLNSINNSFVEA
jgi:hypothetical protein